MCECTFNKDMYGNTTNKTSTCQACKDEIIRRSKAALEKIFKDNSKTYRSTSEKVVSYDPRFEAEQVSKKYILDNYLTQHQQFIIEQIVKNDGLMKSELAVILYGDYDHHSIRSVDQLIFQLKKKLSKNKIGKIYAEDTINGDGKFIKVYKYERNTNE